MLSLAVRREKMSGRSGYGVPVPAGSRDRAVVWVDRLVRRGRVGGRPIEAIRAGRMFAEAEEVAELSIDSSISVREAGDFGKVCGLVSKGNVRRDGFLSGYGATRAYKFGTMKR